MTWCMQRHSVVIETCVLGPADSAFLQQAAHVTGGLYLRPSRPGALLQYLLVHTNAADWANHAYLQLCYSAIWDKAKMTVPAVNRMVAAKHMVPCILKLLALTRSLPWS